MTQVREAIRILEMALPGLPTGTEPHKAVLDSVAKLSKVVPASEAVPGVQATTLVGLQKEAGETAMLQQLMRALGQGEAAPPAQPAGAY